MIQRYPLHWPEGWKRTDRLFRRAAAFGKKRTDVGFTSYRNLTLAEAVQRVHEELERLGIQHVQEDSVISTNLRVNMAGIPRGDQGEPSDPGAAVYWERKGVRQCMAIDQYTRVADNLAAIAATLEAMRAIERHGGAEILNRAFTGFAALPERSSASATWRQALGFPANAQLTLGEAESAYRHKVKAVHGDLTQNDDAMRELNQHRQDFLRELGGK